MILNAMILANSANDANLIAAMLPGYMSSRGLGTVSVIRKADILYVEATARSVMESKREKAAKSAMKEAISENFQFLDDVEACLKALNRPYVVIDEVESDPDLRIAELRDMQGKGSVLTAIYKLEELRASLIGDTSRREYAIAIGEVLPFVKKALVTPDGQGLYA